MVRALQVPLVIVGFLMGLENSLGGVRGGVEELTAMSLTMLSGIADGTEGSQYCGNSDVDNLVGFDGDLPPKEFLSSTDTPKVIGDASKSIKQLCYCYIGPSNCLTMVSVEKKEHFVTNHHALWLLLGEIKTLNRGCPQKSRAFFSVDSEGKETRVRLKTITLSPSAERPEENQQGFEARNHVERARDWDMVLLEVDGLPGVEPLPISSNEVKVGDTVFHGGFPQLTNPNESPPRNAMISSGQVTFFHPNHAEGDFLGVFGTSGGPVLDSDGEMVGLFWGKEGSFREVGLHPDVYRAWKEGRLRVKPERSHFIPRKYLGELLQSKRKFDANSLLKMYR